MPRYTLYIMQNLIGSALLVGFSLTGIVWLTQALRFIDFIINKGATFSSFLTLAVLLIPSLMLTVAPAALFCAVIFVYNKLTTDSELVVMQGAGLSHWQLVRPALYVGAMIALCCYFIAFYLQPITYRQFKDMQNFLRDNYASLLLQEEVFNSPVDGLTVFIRERDKDGILRGILVHDNRETETPVTMMAEEGKIIQTPKGPRFILSKGNRQESREGRLSLLNFDSYTVDMGFYTGKNALRKRDTDELYIHELFASDGLLEKEIAARRAEAHHRLTWPLYCVALPMMGLAFLISGQFNRRGQWRRIGLASVAVMITMLAVFALSNLLIRNPYLAPLPYILAATVMGGSFYTICRERQPLPPAAPALIPVEEV